MCSTLGSQSLLNDFKEPLVLGGATTLAADLLPARLKDIHCIRINVTPASICNKQPPGPWVIEHRVALEAVKRVCIRRRNAIGSRHATREVEGQALL